MLTWTEVWAEVTNTVGDSIEARHIVEQASGLRGTSWLTLLQAAPSADAANLARAMAQRRVAGEPLQYVLGEWSFRHLDLLVDARVLIPRPETEEVVEAALTFLSADQPAVVADLGTGSGAIALSVAQERRLAHVLAVDESTDALSVARLNAERLGTEVANRVEFVHSNWFSRIDTRWKNSIDVIIANPPYVTEEERPGLDSSVLDYEPHSALFAGPDGLDDLKVIVAESPLWLTKGGVLIMEMAPAQTDAVVTLCLEAGFANAYHGLDITGRPRWVVAHRGGSAH